MKMKTTASSFNVIFTFYLSFIFHLSHGRTLFVFLLFSLTIFSCSLTRYFHIFTRPFVVICISKTTNYIVLLVEKCRTEINHQRHFTFRSHVSALDVLSLQGLNCFHLHRKHTRQNPVLLLQLTGVMFMFIRFSLGDPATYPDCESRRRGLYRL